jgi:hypothetical protein
VGRGQLSTAHYDLAAARPADNGQESDRSTLGAGPAENPDKVLVVRRNGTVVTWSVPDATELGRRPGPGPVFGMQRIPGGVITRSNDLFVWWAAGRRQPRVTRRAPAPLYASEAALVSREFGVSWNRDPWSIASTWRLDGHRKVLWRGLIGKPREFDPFIEPEYMQAPHKAGGYYTLATVDYVGDRFVLAHNGMEGIVFVDRDGQADLRLTHEPYGRYQADNALLPGSPYHVEASRSGIRVWDLRTDTQVADARLPEDTVDVKLDARGQAAWTIDKGGHLRRFDLPALTETFRIHLSLIGEEPTLLSADAHDRIAVVDEDLNLYLVNTARGAPSCPVGLSSPAVGCVFNSNGSRVLVAQRNGDILILDLPD